MLRLLAMRRLSALATPALFLEYEEVLKRSEQRTVHGLDERGIERFLAALASAIEAVTLHFAWRPQLRDPADEMVLEAAVNGQVDALVAFNVRDFAEAGERFGIRIVRPADVLKKVLR
jgi:predicted nucleic acid-binding protein